MIKSITTYENVQYVILFPSHMICVLLCVKISIYIYSTP